MSLKRVVLFVLTISLVQSFLLSCTPSLVRTEEQRGKEFLDRHPEASAFLTQGDQKIHYVSFGSPAGRKVIFIHGSPGSWKGFSKFLSERDLTEKAFIIIPDRPGFGESEPEQAMTSLTRQATLLMGLLDLGDPHQSATLIGHSYGGAVVSRMAMFPDSRIKDVIIAAGSVDPSLEHKKWYQYPADWFLFRWMIPRALDHCNQEIEALQGDLTQILPLWKAITAQVHVVQGLDDELVPPENADFIEKQLAPKKVDVTRIPQQGHFLPWERYELLLSVIKKTLF